MSLEEDLDTALEKGGDPMWQVCRVGYVLSKLPSEQSEKLRALVDETPSVTSTEIAGLLRRNGYEVQAQSVRRHRRRLSKEGCLCPQ